MKYSKPKARSVTKYYLNKDDKGNVIGAFKHNELHKITIGINDNTHYAMMPSLRLEDMIEVSSTSYYKHYKILKLKLNNDETV